MKKKLNQITTGISIVDTQWGGFYRGGTYVLIGPRKSGRTLLSLQYAMEGVNNKEVVLYFTNMRPKDLMIQAASIDFDLQTAMNQNRVIVVRVAPPVDLYDSSNPDSYLVEYLNDIVSVVDQYHPSRLIFDELTPFIGFENPGLLQQTFLQMLEAIEEKNVTSLFNLAEPATTQAQTLVDIIAQYSTAIVYLQRKSEDDGPAHGGRATITPNIGHTEGQFTSDYYIEPYKGVGFQIADEKNNNDNFSAQSQNSAPVNYGQQNNAAPISPRITNSKYKPLTNVEQPSNPDRMGFSNLYEYGDFTLILNNQIALYKSTGQSFTLLSLMVDPAAEQQRLLTKNQLLDAIKRASDKKDKICVINDKILVLLGKSDDKNLTSFVNKMRNFFPNQDPNYLAQVMQYIYGFTYDMNDNVVNAEGILKEILEDEFMG